jgi:hypothetical protein
MSGKDLDRKLGDLFREAHQVDAPPPFARALSAAREQRAKQWPAWIWASAATAIALVSIFASARIGIHQQRKLAYQMSLIEPTDPLEFLLDTPGADLVSTVPTFDMKGEWP